MTLQPWTARELAAQRAADFAHEAAPRREVRARALHRCRPGPVALRAGRAFVAVGWRLGGTAALPAAVRRRLA